MNFKVKNLNIFKTKSQKGIDTDSIQASDTNLDYSHDVTKYEKNVTFSGDNLKYSIAGFKLKLERYYLQHLLSYYVPSLIFVVVSWTSFLIPPDAIPGRTALLITILLVLVNFFGTIIRTQPPSVKPTYLAIWIIGCIVFVTSAIFAYAVLLWKRLTPKLNPDSVIAVKPKEPT